MTSDELDNMWREHVRSSSPTLIDRSFRYYPFDSPEDDWAICWYGYPWRLRLAVWLEYIARRWLPDLHWMVWFFYLRQIEAYKVKWRAKHG